MELTAEEKVIGDKAILKFGRQARFTRLFFDDERHKLFNRGFLHRRGR